MATTTRIQNPSRFHGATDAGTGLAYEIEGAGTPVVFLHGLTFDRRTWRPVLDRLASPGSPGGSIAGIAIDLPAHGESCGPPADLADVTDRVHRLLDTLDVRKPVIVGHSMSAAIAAIYGATYPASGIVLVDQGTEVLPFAQTVRRAEPALRGPGFATVWQKIDETLGIDLLPEPMRTQVLETHQVRQEVVLGYWDQILRTDPTELQAWIDTLATKISAPCLAVFGRPLTEGERERFEQMPDTRIEQWPGTGHFVHLAHPDRFAQVLRRFVEYCVDRDR